MASPPSSPFDFASFSSDVSESYNLNSSSAEEEKKKRISAKHTFSKKGNISGTSYKGKLPAAIPVSSLKRSKSDDPLIYQTFEGNEVAFGADINFNESFGSWDERSFKSALLYDDSKDEAGFQMEDEEKVKEKEKEKPNEEADKEGKEREEGEN